MLSNLIRAMLFDKKDSRGPKCLIILIITNSLQNFGMLAQRQTSKKNKDKGMNQLKR